MDYIGTNSQGTANAPNGMSDQLLGPGFNLVFPSPEQAIARFFLGPTSAIRKSDFLASISLLLVSVSLLLVRKSDLLASILLLLVSKSDFLVADRLPSFSDDPSTLRRTPAWPSATVPRPSHSKRNNFLKSFRKDAFSDPVSRVS